MSYSRDLSFNANHSGNLSVLNTHGVRNATLDDIASIENLLRHYADMGDLLPRNRQDIVNNIAHFRVIMDAEELIACGSLEHFTDELAEVRSLMVSESHKGAGFGQIIVEDLIATARQRRAGRLMALTYVPGFFHKLGFKTVSKDIFPEKIWGICVNCYKFHNCDEIAVLLKLN